MKLSHTFLVVVLLAGCASPVYKPLPPIDEPETVSWPPLRVYEVIGEVKGPGRQEYLGKVTITQAIESAGGFTDQADLKRLELRRQNGSVSRYNYYRVIQAPTNNPNIFPGDTLEVKTKRFFR